MLHVFDKHKISREIRSQIWNLEDVKTSSIIGNLLHLPTSIFWYILRNASNVNNANGSKLPVLPDDEEIVDFARSHRYAHKAWRGGAAHSCKRTGTELPRGL